MHLTGKKLLLAGFVAILLIGIPLTIFLLQRQQEVRSHAEKATALSFDPVSSVASPIQKNVGDVIPLSIVVNPGTNLVGWIRVVISYDPTKLATVSAQSGSQVQPFSINPTTSFSFFNGPVYSDGKIEAELSVGSDPTKAIQSTVTLATISLKAIDNTGTTPTTVTYTSETQATSLGSTDQANEDVLSSTAPATIAITGTSSITPTVTPGGGVTSSPTPTVIVTQAPTVTPILATPTPGGGGSGGAANQLPVCSSLNVDRATTGTAPLSLTFTANGTDTDGTISKATFDFGDGPAEDVTDAGGVGTNSVSTQKAHTYNNAGNYIVKVTLTDNGGGVSAIGTCTQTVTVQAAAASGGGTTGGTGGTATLPTTGPGDTIIGVGAVAGLLTIIGAVLFFAL